MHGLTQAHASILHQHRLNRIGSAVFWMIPFFRLGQYARHNRVADNTSRVSVILSSHKRFLQSGTLVRDGSFPYHAKIIYL